MNIALAPNSAVPIGAKRQAHDAEPRTLYVHRPLKNAAALLAWAKAAGFKKTLPPDDMHVTIAFSKAPVDWNGVPDGPDHEGLPAAPDRKVEPLGDQGAVVLRFESQALQKRWQEFCDIGAKWEHDGFRPHVTITYDAGDIDLSTIKPYDGPLEFGEEVFAEVNPKWMETVKQNLQATDSAFLIAMDRDSVREKTRDGRLIVKRTHISKANVCPYRGKEIPGWESLGLDPDVIYNLLRDPEELAKAAPSLNGVQLLIKHIPVNAKDHRPNETVGSLGSDAEFDGEYLDNSLYVNAKHAIDAIESGAQRELSAGYHYKPDMTPGNFRGTAFDGVMRDIVFNHVALVEDGRAGPDVVVGDEALKENDMAKVTRFGARTLSITAAAIAPLLAMDSRVTLPKDLFAPLTTKNFKDSRDKLLSGVRTAIDGKLRKGLALDATMKDFAKAVDAFNDDMTAGVDEPAAEEANPEIEKMTQVEAPKAITEPGSTYDAEPFKSFLREKGMGEDDIMKACDMMPKPALDEDADEDADEEKKKKEAEAAAAAKDAELKAKDSEMKDMVSKPAMDAAIKAATDEVIKRERGIRSALSDVKPWVGELPASMAFDSAADVFRHALTMREVTDAKTMHADALLPVLKSLPKIGAKPAEHSTVTIAMDASAVGKAIKMAPGLENISTAL